MPRTCRSRRTFDAYTIAFGIRNVPRIDVALSEAYRVLKRGGRLLVLEFSEVDMPLLDRVYETWSFNAIPKFGKAITGDAEPYQYLVESIRKFPNQDNFAAMIRNAGFLARELYQLHRRHCRAALRLEDLTRGCAVPHLPHSCARHRNPAYSRPGVPETLSLCLIHSPRRRAVAGFL
jgi:SAM-dependent methyltransferase